MTYTSAIQVHVTLFVELECVVGYPVLHMPPFLFFPGPILWTVFPFPKKNKTQGGREKKTHTVRVLWCPKKRYNSNLYMYKTTPPLLNLIQVFIHLRHHLQFWHAFGRHVRVGHWHRMDCC